MSQPDNSELSDAGLAADADFKASLKRVSYQPGMLLGLEATRAEQDYHRRHVNRHDYWLHGSGTVAGLRVTAAGDDPGDDTTQTKVRLLVSPGIGVDGLGREVTVAEPYCIDLGAWLTTKYKDEEDQSWEALIRDGYDEDNNLLWLKVTLRYREQPSGLQPVLATEVNAGTDPVKPSRLQDGVLLELVAERPKATTVSPFAAHNALPEWNDDLANKLTSEERDRIDNASDEEKTRLQLAARLLHALAGDSEALTTREAATVKPEDLARTLLARVSIELTAEKKLIVNPRRIKVDNLARPFLFNAALLAQTFK